MAKKQDNKKPKKQKDEDLPVISLDSCESFDPLSEKVDSDEVEDDYEPDDYDID